MRTKILEYSRLTKLEADLIEARSTLEKMRKNPPRDLKLLKKAKDDYDTQKGIYVAAVDTHNVHCRANNELGHQYPIKEYLRHDPSEFLEDHANRGIRSASSQLHVSQRREVGKPINVRDIGLRDAKGNRIDLSVDEAAAWSTQEAYKANKHVVEVRLKEGKALKPDEVKMLINGRDDKLINFMRLMPDAQMMAATRIELVSQMLEHSHDLLFSALCRSFSNYPHYPVAVHGGGAILDDKNTIEIKPERIGNEANRKSALAALALPAVAPGGNNTIQQLLEKLAEYGPDNKHVTHFFDAMNIPQEQHAELLGLVRSQHNLLKSKQAMNVHIQKVNKERAEAKGKVEVAEQAMAKHRAALAWNKKISGLPTGSEKSAAAASAAAQTAELLLDEKLDIKNPNALKGKISAPVLKDGSRKGETPAASQAAERSAKRGVKLSVKHFEGPPSDLAAMVALSSAAASNHILDIDNLSASVFELMHTDATALRRAVKDSINSLPVTASYSQAASQAASNAAKKAKSHYLRELKEGPPDQVAAAQTAIAKAAALGGAIYLTLRFRNQPLHLINGITQSVIDHFIAHNSMSQNDIETIMRATPRFADLSDDEQASLLATSEEVYYSSQTALLITQGIKEANAAVSDASIITRTAIKSSVPEGVAKNIAAALHHRFVNGKEMPDEKKIEAAIEREITTANEIINRICDTDNSFLGVAGLDRNGQKIIHRCLIEVAKKYSDTMQLPDLAAIEEILTAKLPVPRPGWCDSEIKLTQVAQGILNKAQEQAAEFEEDGAFPPVATTDRPLISVPTKEKLDEITKKIMTAYKEIPQKAALRGAQEVAKELKLSDPKKIGEAAEQEIAKSPGNLDTAAREAGKLAPSDKNFSGRVALATVIARGIGLPKGEALPTLAGPLPVPGQPIKAIRSAFALGVPRITVTTAASIGAAVSHALVSHMGATTGFRSGLASLAADETMAFFLSNPDRPLSVNHIETMLAETSTHMTHVAQALYNFCGDDKAWLGLDGGAPVNLQHQIRDEIVQHYLNSGEMNNEIALKIITRNVTAHNAALPPGSVALAIPGIANIKVFDPDKIAILARLRLSSQEHLGFPAAPPVDAILLETIRVSMVNFYVTHGTISNDDVNNIVRAKVHMAGAYGLHAEMPTEFNDPIALWRGSLPTVVANPLPAIPAETKKILAYVAYEGYVIATSTQAVKNAEAAHPMKTPDDEKKAPNFREVAAAVTVAALAEGCTQAEALKLSKNLTAHYVRHGNFNSMDLAAFQREVVKVYSHKTLDEQKRLAQLMLRAAPAAASLKEIKEQDAVASGTFMASQVFFTYEHPEHASAMAAAIAKARKGDLSDIGNAAAYARGVVLKAQASPALGLAVVSAAVKEVKALDDDGQLTAAHAAAMPSPELEAAGDRVANQVKDSIAQIERGVLFAALPAFPDPVRGMAEAAGEAVKKAIVDLARELQAQLGVIGGGGEDREWALSMIAKAAAIAGNTVVNGIKSGLTPDEAKSLAGHLTQLNTLKRMSDPASIGHKSDPVATGYVSLASQRIEACFTAIEGIAGIGVGGIARPPVPLNYVYDRAPVTADMVGDKADAEYKRVKEAEYDRLKAGKLRYKPTEQEKAIAEVKGRQAAMNVYLDALKNQTLSEEEAFNQVSARADDEADKAASAVAEYQKTVSGASGIAIPASGVNSKLLKQIIRSNHSAGLIQEGVGAGNPVAVVGSSDKVWSAVQKIVTLYNGGVPAGNQISLAAPVEAKLRDILSQTHLNYKQKALLIAEMLMPAPKEISRALVAVIIHFLAQAEPLEDRARAIAQAVTACSIREDGVLPTLSETDPEKRRKALEAVLNDGLIQLNKEELAAYEEMLKGEGEPSGDIVGIDEGIKHHKLQVVVNVSKDIKLWTIHFAGDDHHQTYNLADLSDFKEILQELEACSKYLKPEIFELAIAEFNKRHRDEHTVTNFFRKQCGLEPLPPTDRIPKDALKRQNNGGLKFVADEMSYSEVKELFKLFAEQAMAAKARDVKNTSGPVDPAKRVPAANKFS